MATWKFVATAQQMKPRRVKHEGKSAGYERDGGGPCQTRRDFGPRECRVTPPNEGEQVLGSPKSGAWGGIFKIWELLVDLC